ncbi:MAG: hypothetical protein ABJ308_17845 [Halieaceae bacterium]
MKQAPQDFSYLSTKDGRVQIFRAGKLASVLRGRDAERFLNRIESKSGEQAQIEMARATGQFKFGNERMGKNSRKR